MANETKTVKKESGSNLTPIIIIGAIFLATVFGIYLISQSGDKDEDNANKNAATANNGGKKSTVTGGTEISNYNTASTGADPPHFKGSASAPVVIEEFADFRCPACKIYHSVINEVTSKYGSRVKVIYRQYPVQPKAFDAAVASEAAGLQGKFWEMQNLIFNNQQNWSNAPNHKQLFAGYAKTIGLDVDRYETDVLGLQTKSRVEADLKRGRELGIKSTPSVIINGNLMNYPSVNNLAGVSAVIDSELEKFQSKDDSQTKSSEASSDKEAEDKGEEKSEEISDK